MEDDGCWYCDTDPPPPGGANEEKALCSGNSQKIIDAAVALVAHWDEMVKGPYGPDNRLRIDQMNEQEIDLLCAVRPEVGR